MGCGPLAVQNIHPLVERFYDQPTVVAGGVRGARVDPLQGKLYDLVPPDRHFDV